MALIYSLLLLLHFYCCLDRLQTLYSRNSELLNEIVHNRAITLHAKKLCGLNEVISRACGSALGTPASVRSKYLRSGWTDGRDTL